MTTEPPGTGTHLSPIHRTNYKVEDDLLNRLALSGLDSAIARLDPDSRRPKGSRTSPGRNARAPSPAGIGRAADDTVLRGKVETEIREVRPDGGR